MYHAAGKTIRNRRLELGISAADVARYLDVSPAFISDVEHGRRKLTWDRTPSVERLLKMTPGTLDILYGRLPLALNLAIFNAPENAQPLARALVEWRMMLPKNDN